MTKETLPCRSCSNCIEHVFNSGLNALDAECSIIGKRFADVDDCNVNFETYGVESQEIGDTMCSSYHHEGWIW